MTNKSQCLSLLEDCLALQLQRVGPPHQDAHYWMYDSGYLLFQGFLEANLKCSWDVSLTTAVRDLSYRGYVCPGILVVAGGQPALHLIRSAWSRRVLKPPPNYTIALLGDIEDCTVSKVRQTGFTPLPDAVCWVILQLSSSGKNAVLDSIQDCISSTFPDIQQPTKHLLYDTLAELTSDNKVYQTAQGYFLASPEKQRESARQVLLTHAEAAAMVSGEIVTIREGARTHQAIQTNLADVICGGNKSDKVLYARAPPKTAGRKLERRHSMRLLGSSRRLSSLHRAGSVRLLHHNTPLPDNNQKKSSSLFSKLFKWPKRQAAPPAVSGVTSHSMSIQFPPQEWFNSTVLGLNSVGTQTKTLSRNDGEWSECGGSVRSRRRSLSTSRLPRRQARAPSASPARPSAASTPTSSKTLLCAPTTPKALSSASSGYNSLPRSHKSKLKLDQTQPSPPQHLVKVEVSASPTGSVTTDTQVDTRMSASIHDPSAMMTTTIDGPNSTKIFVQQQNSPIRSVITFEKGRKQKITEKVKEEERSTKIDLKRTRRPPSLYQQRENKDSPCKNKVNLGHLDKNIKMKFPSTETIQLEEKLLLAGKNNNICHKNSFDPSNIALKAGSLIDVADCSTIDGQMNNVRKASLSLMPLQPTLSSDKVLESLIYKNVLKESQLEFKLKKEGKNFSYNSNNKIHLTNEKTMDVPSKKGDSEISPFPSLTDLSLHFTSLAAQNILNGVSINSLDTLVESEKNIKDMSIHTDLGIV